MLQFARHVALPLALYAMTGCAGLLTEHETMRMLVQFDVPVTEPAAPALLRELEQVTGAKIRYLQTVGRGIHVYLLEGTSRTLRDAAAKLSSRPDVRFAQPDRRMRPLEGTRAGG